VNYIGPFLRMNTLTQENIEKQLLHYAKESFKHIVLNSNCGITTSINDLKLKNISNFDINTFKKTSPLLCVYKKANPKLVNDEHHLKWDETTFKKEINVSSNAYMTLTLIELCGYYSSFEEKDNVLYSLGKIYNNLAKNQLDFYSSNLRNIEGVFVDKKDCSDSITGEYNFQEKTKKFKYSDQALLMSAYYKLSTLPDIKDGEAYKNFSLDILNMFIDYKHELYNLSFEELNKLCFAFNVFYDYSANNDAKMILIDICDLLLEKFHEDSEQYEDKVEYKALLHINLSLAEKNTEMIKFKDSASKIYDDLVNMYDSEKGVFLKSTDKKDMDFYCQEVVLYIASMLLNQKYSDSNNFSVINNVYIRQLINSGLVLSWPDTPPLNNAERYSGFTLKSSDLLEDINFRLSTAPSPESAELAPVLIKSIEYNRKKETFSQGNITFDSTKNMPLLFMIIYLFGKC
jgi:hypothetical protein